LTDIYTLPVVAMFSKPQILRFHTFSAKAPIAVGALIPHHPVRKEAWIAQSV